VIKLHRILERAAVKASPTVLWCYKKELGFGRYNEKGIIFISNVQFVSHLPNKDFKTTTNTSIIIKHAVIPNGSQL
jgi:hypothetical protein